MSNTDESVRSTEDVPRAELWRLANEMRDLEDDAWTDPEVRLEKYKALRGELESLLAEHEGVDLPEGHIQNE